MGMPSTYPKGSAPAAPPASGATTHAADGRAASSTAAPALPTWPREFGGVDGPEPTRFGDWEKNGRCIDF
jgi:hypothetical protein